MTANTVPNPPEESGTLKTEANPTSQPFGEWLACVASALNIGLLFGYSASYSFRLWY
jgi:hypothetical protein